MLPPTSPGGRYATALAAELVLETSADSFDSRTFDIALVRLFPRAERAGLQRLAPASVLASVRMVYALSDDAEADRARLLRETLPSLSQALGYRVAAVRRVRLFALAIDAPSPPPPQSPPPASPLPLPALRTPPTPPPTPSPTPSSTPPQAAPPTSTSSVQSPSPAWLHAPSPAPSELLVPSVPFTEAAASEALSSSSHSPARDDSHGILPMLAALAAALAFLAVALTIALRCRRHQRCDLRPAKATRSRRGSRGAPHSSSDDVESGGDWSATATVRSMASTSMAHAVMESVASDLVEPASVAGGVCSSHTATGAVSVARAATGAMSRDDTSEGGPNSTRALNVGHSEASADVHAVRSELLMLDRLRVLKLERAESGESNATATNAAMATVKAVQAATANAEAAVVHGFAAAATKATAASLAIDPSGTEVTPPSASASAPDELPTGAAEVCEAPSAATTAPSTAAPRFALATPGRTDTDTVPLAELTPVHLPTSHLSSVRAAHARVERVGCMVGRSERVQVRPSDIPGDIPALGGALPTACRGSMATGASATAGASATIASCAWGNAFFFSSAARGPPPHTQ